jgi:hypothetical protein
MFLERLRDLSRTVVSNHILSVATFYTIVATNALLSPLLSNFVSISEQLSVDTLRSSVATRGEWRQGWTLLL